LNYDASDEHLGASLPSSPRRRVPRAYCERDRPMEVLEIWIWEAKNCCYWFFFLYTDELFFFHMNPSFFSSLLPPFFLFIFNETFYVFY